LGLAYTFLLMLDEFKNYLGLVPASTFSKPENNLAVGLLASIEMNNPACLPERIAVFITS